MPHHPSNAHWTGYSMHACMVCPAHLQCVHATRMPCCRTMEIIDHLEQGPRGVYSGACPAACLPACQCQTPCCTAHHTHRHTRTHSLTHARPQLPSGLGCPCPPCVCAGSLGYISFNDTFDLNIVIRTAVLQHDRISIGAGGAIVVQSGEPGPLLWLLSVLQWGCGARLAAMSCVQVTRSPGCCELSLSCLGVRASACLRHRAGGGV